MHSISQTMRFRDDNQSQLSMKSDNHYKYPSPIREELNASPMRKRQRLSNSP